MKKHVFIFSLLIIFSACQGSGEAPAAEGNENDTINQETYTDEKSSLSILAAPDSMLTIKPLEDFYEFEEAPNLALLKPVDKAVIEQEKVDFNFTVENFTLGEQTPLPPSQEYLANSAKGQHIHLILNNAPYQAHYEASFSENLPVGHHYAVAFLSRSYHLSVKNPMAYRAFQFTVKESQPNQPKLYPLDEPTLFYSRPKGTYSGAGAQNILFDFYLHNVELSAEGFKVKLTIDDKNEYLISAWEPYMVSGLSNGTHIFKTELINNVGKAVNPEINTVVREIKIEKE